MSATLTLVTALDERFPVAVADLAGLQRAARDLFGGYGEAVAPTLARIDAATTLQAAADELARSTGAHLSACGPNDLTCIGFLTVGDERIRCNFHPHGLPESAPTSAKQH